MKHTRITSISCMCLAIMCLLFTLTGCSSPFLTSEAKEKITEHLAELPSDETYTLGDLAYKRDNMRTYNVTTSSGVDFHIASICAEDGTWYFDNDLDQCILQNLAETYPGDPGFEIIPTTVETNLFDIYFQSKISSRAELETSLGNAEKFAEYLKEKDYKGNCVINYCVTNEDEEREIYEFSVTITYDENTNSYYLDKEEAIRTYQSILLDFRCQSMLNEYNDSEIKEMYRNTYTAIGKKNEDNTVSTIKGAFLNADTFCMSYETLFALCQEEGLEVTGDPSDFTVISKNGDVYRMGYDMEDAMDTNGFYLNDDWAYLTDNIDYNHVSLPFANGVLGCKLVCIGSAAY